MAWFWTDDLGKLLIEEGIDRRAVTELLARPAAIAADDRAAALEVARRIAGVDDRQTDAA